MTERIAPCLWCDGDAEAMARFYCDVFPDSRIDAITRSTLDWSNGGPGDVLIVAFTLMGRSMQALNGGAGKPFTEAISLSVECADQEEVDQYWHALSADPTREMCGWLRDRFGVSWQVVPRVLPRLLAGPDVARAQRVMTAMMGMTKLDVAALEAA